MKQSYSLSELSYLIGDSLAQTMPRTYWVRAEIASMNERGGHCYFELVEKKDVNGLLTAKMRAVCWQNLYVMLSSFFSMETGKNLQTGMQILAEVEVSFHAVYGLSLNIVGIDPAYTIGRLHKQREETIERLKKEGVFEMQQLLSLPTLIRSIAVVSSPEAAGYGDFCNQLTANAYGFTYKTTLFPAIMQGERAALSLITALEQVYERQAEFDVVVIIRGGGATTDLTCFDDYLLASTCAQLPLPVLTGIGHHKDTSVVDLVAFQALKTPTAVAEFILSRSMAQVAKIDGLQHRLQQVLVRVVAEQHRALDQYQRQIYSMFQLRLSRYTDQLNAYEKIIRLLSPESLYKKGYTLTLVNGRRVKSAGEVKQGDVLSTEFMDGKVISIVQDK